ncbi:hypothetical protein [Desulfopila inferna]|uniref:hypothetical protein n=1 Tax=Desulfopila inferna TaxID=468528 RepID=UPI001965D85E|nr:hypothetical protein [Desulfopila inferna]MBM9604083.1 hypothetical protein [Desulfopila inferna]
MEKKSRSKNIPGSPGFVERRKNRERRQNSDRRCSEERRHDFRNDSKGRRKSLRGWLRSITNARLGVDRRKGERRSNLDRRQQNLQSLLTQDEISDLLE